MDPEDRLESRVVDFLARFGPAPPRAGTAPCYAGRMLRSVLALGLAPLLLVACSDRAVPSDDMGDESGDTMSGDPQAGVQPTEPGVMYSPCQRSAECAPLEFCVFPSGESGYCTAACSAPTDPGNCEPPPGDQPQACFDIGLEDGRWVCALDCASAPCPQGMRCEQIETAAGARSICF